MSLVEAYEDSHVWQWHHQEGDKRDSRQAFDPASNEEIESAYRTGEAACAYMPPEARGSYYSQWSVHLRGKPMRMVRGYSNEERVVLRERDELREEQQADELAQSWGRAHQAALDSEFTRFADPPEEDDSGPGEIGIEGIERLCEEIGVDTQDVVVLVLSWYMRAREMCVFTREEWGRGMAALQCTQVSELRERVGDMRDALEDWKFFCAVYKWTFSFAKENDQKSLGKEEAMGLWPILLAKRWSLVDSFVVFMGTVRERVVSRDLWQELLEFLITGAFGADLGPYLENEAWPVLLDDFLEWLQEGEGKDALAAAVAAEQTGDVGGGGGWAASSGAGDGGGGAGLRG